MIVSTALSTLLLALGPQVAPAQGISAGGQQPEGFKKSKSYFQTVIGTPTGKNAYEEYVRAYEAVDNEYLFLIEGFEQWVRANRPAPQPTIPQGLSPNSSLLDIQRAKLNASGDMIALLESGSGKPCYRPGMVTTSTLFPEFAGMKRVAKIAVECASAEFANGRPERAVRILKNTLLMGHKISDGILIASLVGTAIKSIVIANVRSNAMLISETGWKELEECASRILAEPPTELTAARNELIYMKQSIRQVLVEGKFEGVREQDAKMKELAQLPVGQKEQLFVDLSKKIDESMAPAIKQLAGPEAGWSVPLESPEEVELPSIATPLQTLYWFATQGSVFGHVSEVAAKGRTQMRLLALTAHIHRYRFHHGRLPNTLQEGIGDAEIDPLTLKPFIYERKSEFEFRLASRGTKALGEIDLKYTRPTQTGEDKSIPPR